MKCLKILFCIFFSFSIQSLFAKDLKSIIEPRDLILETYDGAEISCRFYPLEGNENPALILLHSLGRSKDDWNQIAPEFQKRGYAILTIDLRGHGNSINMKGKSISYKDFDKEDYKNMVYDIGAAYIYLRNREEVDKSTIGIIGTGLGANLAPLYFIPNPELKNLLLISPNMGNPELKTVLFLSRLHNRRTLIITSKDDINSMNVSDRLSKSCAQNCDLEIIERKYSGIDILKYDLTMIDRISNWFNSNMKKSREIGRDRSL
jgi:dienelactone hydrolase